MNHNYDGSTLQLLLFTALLGYVFYARLYNVELKLHLLSVHFMCTICNNNINESYAKTRCSQKSY